MAIQLNFLNSLLCLLLISTKAHCFNDNNSLVNANKLKNTGFLDGDTGSVSVDINDDGYQDSIEYTFSSIAPPGTCDQSDCMSKLDNSPILTFHIKMHNGKSYDGTYMCTSLGVSSIKHNKMKDVLCGPRYVLRWNGKEYVLGSRRSL